MTTFSIVMPTYRDDRFVRDALESAIAQPAALRSEILVADDASPGTMRDTLRAIGSGELRLVLRERNLGLFANLNAAIAEARGPGIVLLCQDDELLPHALEEAARWFDGADLALFVNEAIDEHGAPLPSIARYVFDRITPDHAHLFGPHELTPWLLREGSLNGNLTGMVMRREAFLAIGGFDATRTQIPDWELLHRFSRRGGVRLVKTAIARVRSHPAQLSAVNSRAGINSEEVGHMVRTLLDDEALRGHPDAKRWARRVMQNHLWMALKSGLSPRGDREVARRILRAVHRSTGIGPTALELARLIPRRVVYKLGLVSREEPLSR